jgi:hypothetical protein
MPSTPKEDDILSYVFYWREFDTSRLLPPSRLQEIKEFALLNYTTKIIVPTSITSREATTDIKIPVLTVGGRRIRSGLPWLFELYGGPFLGFAQLTTREQVLVAADDRYAVNLNVQRGGAMRYECHVDSNPIEGLLYVTSHAAGSGGELVVSNRSDVLGTEEIQRDSVRIYPESGKLFFFDARRHPHFVAPLKKDDDIRVVVAMNYYTTSCTEDMRPADLNKHLGLE